MPVGLTKNPLRNALRKKAEQLRGASGMTGIIVGNGDCAILRELPRTRGKVGARGTSRANSFGSTPPSTSCWCGHLAATIHISVINYAPFNHYASSSAIYSRLLPHGKFCYEWDCRAAQSAVNKRSPTLILKDIA